MQESCSWQKGKKACLTQCSLCSVYQIQENLSSSDLEGPFTRYIHVLQLGLMTAWGTLSANLQMMLSGVGVGVLLPIDWRTGLWFWRTCEGWSMESDRNFAKIKIANKFLHHGANYYMHLHRARTHQLGRCSAQKDPVCKVGNKLNKSQQHALATKKSNGILGCCRKTVASIPGGSSFTSIQHLWDHIWNDLSRVLASQYRKHIDILEWVLHRAMWMVRALDIWEAESWVCSALRREGVGDLTTS